MRIGFMVWMLCSQGSVVGCGTVKPTPPATCVSACAHLKEIGCSTSKDTCEGLCATQVANQPSYPGCVSEAPSCRLADACR